MEDALEYQELKKCLKIHGYISSEEESESESKPNLDEVYRSYQPPPIQIDPKKHKIIVAGAGDKPSNNLCVPVLEPPIKEATQNESDNLTISQKKRRRRKLVREGSKNLTVPDAELCDNETNCDNLTEDDVEEMPLDDLEESSEPSNWEERFQEDGVVIEGNEEISQSDDVLTIVPTNEKLVNHIHVVSLDGILVNGSQSESVQNKAKKRRKNKKKKGVNKPEEIGLGSELGSTELDKNMDRRLTEEQEIYPNREERFQEDGVEIEGNEVVKISPSDDVAAKEKLVNHVEAVPLDGILVNGNQSESVQESPDLVAGQKKAKRRRKNKKKKGVKKEEIGLRNELNSTEMDKNIDRSLTEEQEIYPNVERVSGQAKNTMGDDDDPQVEINNMPRWIRKLQRLETPATKTDAFENSHLYFKLQEMSRLTDKIIYNNSTNATKIVSCIADYLLEVENLGIPLPNCIFCISFILEQAAAAYEDFITPVKTTKLNAFLQVQTFLHDLDKLFVTNILKVKETDLLNPVDPSVNYVYQSLNSFLTTFVRRVNWTIHRKWGIFCNNPMTACCEGHNLSSSENVLLSLTGCYLEGTPNLIAVHKLATKMLQDSLGKRRLLRQSQTRSREDVIDDLTRDRKVYMGARFGENSQSWEKFQDVYLNGEMAPKTRKKRRKVLGEENDRKASLSERNEEEILIPDNDRKEIFDNRNEISIEVNGEEILTKEILIEENGENVSLIEFPILWMYQSPNKKVVLQIFFFFLFFRFLLIDILYYVLVILTSDIVLIMLLFLYLCVLFVIRF